MKTASSNKKVRELIMMVTENKLIPRPEFQRRLVWTRDDKNRFIDTVLRGYPFPEIYLADGEVNTETGEGTQLLVDGQQRISTLIQYFQGDPLLRLTTVPPYRELEEGAKKLFLQYDVAVRDLGGISKEEIVEVFKRINATKYSLNEIEINNAIYDGKLKKFAERVANLPSFTDAPLFNSLDYKRMGDLRFSLLLICTMLAGYFNRDDLLEELLDRYNDDFPDEEDIFERVTKVMDFLGECGFLKNSRLWKKADFFTCFIELDSLLKQGIDLDPYNVVTNLNCFYDTVNQAPGAGTPVLPMIYYNAAVQASNDRVNRARRAVIIEGVLTQQEEMQILEQLRKQSLIT